MIDVNGSVRAKLNLDGSVQKIRARLVANGYSQNPRIDFNETFAPMAGLGNIKTLIALVAQKG